MSQTLADVERRVRYHLRDRKSQGGAYTSPEYAQCIEANMREVAGQLLLGESQVLGLVALQPGVQFYSLTVAGQDIEGIRYLKTASDGLPVTIVAPNVFEAWRAGDTVTSGSRGRPQIAMMRESDAQVTQLGFWPIPAVADTVDGYRSLLPARFFTAGTGAMALLPGATIIPFDDEGCDALCYRVAAELFGRMTDGDRTALRLASTSADGWPGKAAALIAAV